MTFLLFFLAEIWDIYNSLALIRDYFAWKFFSSFSILWLLWISSCITNWGVTSFMHNCTSEYLISLHYQSAGKPEFCQCHCLIRWDISIVTLLLTVIFTALILKEYAYVKHHLIFYQQKLFLLTYLCCLSYSYITPIS